MVSVGLRAELLWLTRLFPVKWILKAPEAILSQSREIKAILIFFNQKKIAPYEHLLQLNFA